MALGKRPWLGVAGLEGIDDGQRTFLVAFGGANQNPEELAPSAMQAIRTGMAAPQAADWLPQRRIREKASCG